LRPRLQKHANRSTRRTLRPSAGVTARIPDR
jgi:hypothetical protein